MKGAVLGIAAMSALVLVAAACAAPQPAPSSTVAASPVGSPAAVTVSPSPTAPAVQHTVAASPNPELRDELLAMMVEDQAVRTGIPPPGDTRTAEELFAAWNSVDAANAERMREILDEFGWPGWSLVGEDGALAAWVLIQHADLEPDLQERGLVLLEAAVEADDASPGDLAYLVDRVRVANGERQVYGTQVTTGPDGEIMPRTPIEDEANVDARRAAAGLSTLAEYYAELRAMEPEPTP